MDPVLQIEAGALCGRKLGADVDDVDPVVGQKLQQLLRLADKGERAVSGSFDLVLHGQVEHEESAPLAGYLGAEGRDKRVCESDAARGGYYRCVAGCGMTLVAAPVEPRRDAPGQVEQEGVFGEGPRRAETGKERPAPFAPSGTALEGGPARHPPAGRPRSNCRRSR